MAERYLAAHWEPPWPYKVTVGRGRLEGSKVDEGLSKQELGGGARSNHSTAGLICFNCHQPGHKAALCPLKKAKEANVCHGPGPELQLTMQTSQAKSQYTTSVLVNGQSAEALLDTGSSMTLVKAKFVDNETLNFGDLVGLGCVHGDKRMYPTVNVNVVIEGQAYMMKVGVVNQLSHDVILGDELLVLSYLVQSVSKSCVVVTRFQAKGLQPLPNLHPDLTEGGKKVRKDKKQHCWDKHVGKARVQDPVPVAPNPETTLLDPQWQVPDNFKELHRSDPLLQPLFAKVCEIDGVPVKQAPLIGDKYILIDNLLYIVDTEVARLVVPKSLHPLILYLGHHIPWAGYLGQQKSYDIISQRFYWPRLYQDVQEYCRTCTDCQKKVAPVRKSDRGLLQPLPMIGTPFERLGMDIIGPLVKSSSGHRFALVICNYSTRYPEVYPLLSIRA